MTYGPPTIQSVSVQAFYDALVSRGKRRGMLLAQCPRSDSDAAAAWQAVVGYANPYKLSIATIMFFTSRQSAIYKHIDDSLKGADLRGLDRDRVALERIGAW